MARKETVKKVIDGDTFTTTAKNRTHAVRLANVDAPELGKPGGAAAKTRLQRMIGGKQVSITTVAHDVYGRSVARVTVGRKSINKAVRPARKK